MNAKITNYRNTEHIAKKVQDTGSFTDYIKSITPGTARNYQKFLVDYVNKYENGNPRYHKLIRESLITKVNYDLKKQVETIFKRISEKSIDSKMINIIEDLEFIIFIALINEKNKDKLNLNYEDITYLEKNNTTKILLKGEQKYIVISENALFKKALDSIKGLKDQKIFQTNSFVKLIENQFLSSGFKFSRDIKSFKDHIKVHYVKQSI